MGPGSAAARRRGRPAAPPAVHTCAVMLFGASAGGKRGRDSMQGDDDATAAMIRDLWAAARLGQSHGTLREFQEFYHKLQAFQQRQQRHAGGVAQAEVEPGKRPASAAAEGRLELPARFDARYRINLAVPLDEGRLLAEAARQHQRHRGGGGADWARREDAAATLHSAKQALAHFVDFHQKKRFRRLAQLQHDRRQLPIAQHQQEIIDAVQQHQVLVLAGDTGVLCAQPVAYPGL
jgi:HrpA-like RNA helicase